MICSAPRWKRVMWQVVWAGLNTFGVVVAEPMRPPEHRDRSVWIGMRLCRRPGEVQAQPAWGHLQAQALLFHRVVVADGVGA